MSVKGDKVECAINGTVVGTYDKSALRRRRQAQVDRRHLRHALRPQHGSVRDRSDDDEELASVAREVKRPRRDPRPFLF